MQLCAKSEQEPLRRWAFRKDTATDLFDYYLEWNEKDQHRSMRLVLDVVSTLVLQNPDAQVRDSLKAEILPSLVAIIARRSARPVVKSCISSLTAFLMKRMYTLDDLARHYTSLRPELAGQPVVVVWQDWVAQLFQWMKLQYICPVSGKLLIYLFSALHAECSAANAGQSAGTGVDISVLRQWLEAAISTHPDIFENVKNYVLGPMFKSDRGLSVALLRDLNKIEPGNNDETSHDEDVPALLHLAALEVGKKTGVVDDPGEYFFNDNFGDLVSNMETKVQREPNQWPTWSQLTRKSLSGFWRTLLTMSDPLPCHC